MSFPEWLVLSLFFLFLFRKQESISMTTLQDITEIKANIDAMKASLVKINTDVTTLLDKLAAVPLPADVLAVIAELKTSSAEGKALAQGVDDRVEDPATTGPG